MGRVQRNISGILDNKTDEFATSHTDLYFWPEPVMIDVALAEYNK